MADPAARSLLVCYGPGRPALRLVDPFTGRSQPFAAPIDRAGIACDAAHRCGDGIVLEAHGARYGIAADLTGPAYDLGRSPTGASVVTRSGVWRPSPTSGALELVSWKGELVASRAVPAGWRPIGETTSGPVVLPPTSSGAARRIDEHRGDLLGPSDRPDQHARADRHDHAAPSDGGAAQVLGPDGRAEPVPGDGEILAVADRHLVRVGPDGELRIVDVVTGTALEVARPATVDGWWTTGARIDPAHRRAALVVSAARPEDGGRARRSSVLAVVDLATGALRVGDPVDGPLHPVWSADGSHLFVGDTYHDRLHVVDTRTLRTAESPAGRVGSSPRLDIGDVAPSVGAAPTRVWVFGESIDAIPRTLAAAEADLAERLEKVDAGVRDDLRRAVRPSIRFVRADDQERIGTGHSRVGGQPDLPAGTAWPTARGAPLAFIGQVDLDATARMFPSPLPRSGTLLFFFGPYLDTDYAAVEASCVLYAPPHRELEPRSWPADLPADARFDAVHLEPAIEMTLPNHLDAWPADHWAAVEQAATSRIAGPVHRMLGHPDLVHGDELDDLVMQFDSDAEAGCLWGDSGRLFFTVDGLTRVGTAVRQVRAHVESG